LRYVPKVEPSVGECVILGAFYLHDEAGELDEAEKFWCRDPCEVEAEESAHHDDLNASANASPRLRTVQMSMSLGMVHFLLPPSW
jgi:hypothetical protein